MLRYASRFAALSLAVLTLSTAAHAQSARMSDAPARILAGHNEERSWVGLPPLTWDDSLARSATAYAAELASTDRFEHSDSDVGENLWMGTRNAFSIETMVDGWREERKYYKHGPIPHVSTTGNFGDVGHYTQIISRVTTRVGCGIRSSRGFDYLVCHYDPAGNITGRPPM